MNHITIEFCKEDRQRIDELIGLAAWITGALKDLAANTTAAKMEKMEPIKFVNEHPVDDVSPHAAPESDPNQLSFFDQAPAELVNYTKADVQALVMKLAAPGTGKKEAVKAIVNEYAKKISDIPEEKLNEVMAKLNQLAEEE